MRYVFGSYELDPGSYELRSAAGPCQIEPKVFDLLVYLIQQRGQVVAKDELLAHLWPNQFVSESALTYCVMAARKAIGDSGQAQRFIKTVFGRGYRFIAVVEEQPPGIAREVAGPHSQAESAPGADPLPRAVSTPEPQNMSALPAPEHRAVTAPLPLVGREDVLERLWECWRRTTTGIGQVVWIQGEAGIGKSRLLQALQARLKEAECTWLASCGVPCYQHSALFPFVTLWQQRVHGQQAVAPTELVARLVQVLNTDAVVPQTVLSGLVALLKWPLHPPVLTPRQQRQQCFEALQTWLLRAAQQRPVILVLEDCQWLDASTLEFLGLLVQRSTTSRLLVLLTSEPELHFPWALPASLIQITLNRLPPLQAERLVQECTGGKALPEDICRLLVATADGLPLWVDMLTRMVLESGLVIENQGRYGRTDPRLPLALPVTLPDTVMARLERLGAAKQIAQWGATLGSVFPYAWLQLLVPMDEESLQQGLGQLVTRGFLAASQWSGQAHYAFTHPRLREVIYHAMLPSIRHGVHKQIVQTLAEQFPDLGTTQPEWLAMHAAAADLRKEALGYWQKAGQQALASAAYSETLVHFTQGIQALTGLVDIPARTRQELTLQSTLGTALLTVQGYTAEEKEQAYTRARELCHPAPEAPLSFQILQGLWAFHLLRADYETASELMTEGLALVRHLPHPTPPLVARVALGSTRFFLGDLPGAQEYLTPGNASEARQHLGPAPMVPDVVAQGLVYRAMVGWLSGHPGTALQSIREALALAQELSQPLTQVFVLTWATWLVAGAVLPALQGLLAAAYCKAGQIDAGLAVIRAALSQGEQHRAPCYWTAELHRLKGELVFVGQTGPESYLETAESCFQHALEVSRQQHARWLELRAAVSLSQLWQQHGRRDAARHLLTEICGHFAAGDEVPDLQTARDLCAALE